MNRPFEVHLPLQPAYVRRARFAVELLDAVTLARIVTGIEVTAVGLSGLPTRTASGLFVWTSGDLGNVQTILVDPRLLPYARVEFPGASLQRPPAIATIELPPRVAYPFTAGVTGLRGTLIEHRVPRPDRPEPLVDAQVRLRWLDDDGSTWHDAPTGVATDAQGDFAAPLRLHPTQAPRLDANGALSVRLHVRYDRRERHSQVLPLRPGRVADLLTFAWDELNP